MIIPLKIKQVYSHPNNDDTNVITQVVFGLADPWPADVIGMSMTLQVAPSQAAYYTSRIGQIINIEL